MSWRIVFGLILLAFVLLPAILPAPAEAAIFQGGRRYIVAPGDTITDDVILGTGEGLFDGVLTQDVIFAGRRYKVAGQVMGNVMSASQYATIRGTVDKSVRLFAQTANIDGVIGSNLLAFCNDIDLSSESRIGRDVVIFGSEVSVSGEIGRNLTIRAGRAIISGKIGGELDLKADKITIVAPAEITGGIKYRSKNEIQIEDGVTIGGEVKRLELKDKDAGDDGTSWPFRFMLFLCALTTGLLLIAGFNRHTKLAVGQTLQKPLFSMGIGFISLCIAPIAFIVLALTVIGLPAAIILLFTVTIFFYTAKTYVAIALGRLALRQVRKDADPKQGWSLLVGLAIMFFVFAIPVLGTILYFVTIFIGMGAMVYAVHACREAPAPSSAAPPNLPA